LISVSEVGLGDEQSERDVQKDHGRDGAANGRPRGFRIPAEEAGEEHQLGDEEGGHGTSEDEDAVGEDGAEDDPVAVRGPEHHLGPELAEGRVAFRDRILDRRHLAVLVFEDLFP